MDKKVSFYMHNGSGNHGCEALVRSIANIVNTPVNLYTRSIAEDEKYIDASNISYKEVGKTPNKNTLDGIIYRLKMKFLNQKYAFVVPAYKNLLKNADENTIAFSIGGDNYCYDGMPEVLAILNKKLNEVFFVAINNMISQLRSNTNMSQEDFAELFGVSRQSVQKWENGTSVPELDK